MSANVQPAGTDPVSRHIVIVAFDGVEAIDVTGPASAFAKASLAVPAAYRLTVASPHGGNVNTSAGLAIAATASLGAFGESHDFDTIIVAGGEEAALRRAVIDDGAAQWVARAAAHTRRIASVCTGAFVLRGGAESQVSRSLHFAARRDIAGARCDRVDREPS
ncbi:DJ-1/PfpI family protein [Pandoraea horticolens]|uniref:DJ-1/PfpI family protein n=1 Tax=Pandoraea horticolens TaxID=2508298 RepID=UPI001FE4A8A0|nr:DJ-1/PfpI family protein [Pandoraea horticolens]